MKTKVKFKKTKATIFSVTEFPLTGAIANYKLDCCGMQGGQPIYGKPEKNQHLIGKKFLNYCISKSCSGKL